MVTVVWSGRGYLTLIVWVVCVFLFVFVLPEAYRNSYAPAIATFTTGIFNWFFGNKWNIQQAKIEVDEETGQQYLYKNQHTFFWVPMQYWGLVLSIVGIWLFYKYSLTISGIAAAIFIGMLVLHFTKKGSTKNESSSHIESAPIQHDRHTMRR